MITRDRIILAGWVLGNFVAVWLIAFASYPLLRYAGWAWVSAAISVSGLVSVGGIFNLKGS